MHKSKGITRDIVIVLNMNSDMMGMPATRESDPILDAMLSKEDNFPFAEERRLFYVAITRAREATYLIANRKNPSPFIFEISNQTQTYDLYDTYFMDGDEYARLVVCGNRMRIEGKGEDYDHLLEYFGISDEWYEFTKDESGYFASEPQPYYQTDYCYLYFPNRNFVILVKSPFYSTNWKFISSNAGIDSEH